MDHDEEQEVLTSLPSGDAAFSALMDFMVQEETEEEAGTGGEETDLSAGSDGLPTDTGENSGAGATPDGTGGGGAEGEPSLSGDGDASSLGGAPSLGEGVGSVDASSLAPQWAQMGEAIETRFQETYTSQALEETREEYAKYFEMLEKHPRMLVGQEVPSLMGEGMEVLRDSADAREWQEAVQQLLVSEVKDRAQKAIEGERSTLDTLHGSIELFANNPDLIPGTKGFNKVLAERFVEMTKDYEVRVDGKLTGYKVPVQGLISSLRQQLQRETAAAPQAPAPVKKQEKIDPPQKGIPSTAGNAGDGPEDFSTLFGTLGLPNLRI